MNYREDQPVEVNVVYLFPSREGDAIKVEDADGRQIWLDLIEIDGEFDPNEHDQGDEITITIPTSVATRKALV